MHENGTGHAKIEKNHLIYPLLLNIYLTSTHVYCKTFVLHTCNEMFWIFGNLHISPLLCYTI